MIKHGKFFKIYLRQIVVISVATSVLIGFVVWYVNSERTIYFWDNSGYWMKTRWLADNLLPATKSTISNIIYSIRNDEYNLLFAVPLSFILMIFGDSRLTYILSIVILYYIPAVSLISYFIFNATKRLWLKLSNKWSYVLIWTLVGLNPFLILPVVGGYPDVVGLIPLTIALIIYQKKHLNLRIRSMVVIAMLLVITTLLRRWYIFGCAGFLLGIAIDQLRLVQFKLSVMNVKKIATLLILPLLYLGLFVAIAYPYVSNQLIGTDYVNKYAAYKFHKNYFELAWFCIKHYGVIYIAVSVIGMVTMLKKKLLDSSSILILVVSHLFAFFAVGKIQTFDTHQYYLLTIGLLLGIVSIPAIIYYLSKKLNLFWMAIASIMVFYCITGFFMYQKPLKNILITEISATPNKRTDIIALKKLYSTVEEMQDKSGSKVYVLACSFNFNVDLFRNIPLSTNDFKDTIADADYAPSAIFDVAQGFHMSFFDAGIVVDSNPVGYITTNIEEQQIISLLHDELGNGGILTPYYRRHLDTYNLDKGYEVILYERMHEIPKNIRDQVVTDIKKTHKTVPIFKDSETTI